MNTPLPHPPASLIASGAPRFLFFTGKGGVGKTSLAGSIALRLADGGKRVLLISTDPASNLDEVLGLSLSRTAVPVPGATGLSSLNINPEEAARAYREKIIDPMRTILPEAALRSMEEQLSGACTMEIAAFDEFVSFLGAEIPAYDHVVFDTAPTGHTLRLMSLSRAWTGFLDQNTSGTSCLGPLAGLEKQRELYRASVEALADPKRTRVILVTRAQKATLKEAQRTSREMTALGILNQALVINGIFSATDHRDPIATGLESRGQHALAEFQGFLQSLPVYATTLRASNMIGLEALRSLPDPDTGYSSPSSCDTESPAWPDLSALVGDLQIQGHGVIMTMGKGGVGKTTLAAAIALELARRGEKVHLSTTDPAAHIADAAGAGLPGLTVNRIDPAGETSAYVAEVMASQGMALPPESRALLEEDLRSPCTEEIAVFRAFARAVAGGKERFVILDTAPTGHTLLLLDATEAYHRELGRQSRQETPEEVRELLPRLRDPRYTRVVIVALPEATPVHEAAALQSDLVRAGIHPWTWVVNQSLAAAGVTDPLLQSRAANELPYLREVADLSPRPPVLVAYQGEEPSGPGALKALLHLPSPVNA